MNIYIYIYIYIERERERERERVGDINSKEHHHTTFKKVAFKISFVLISSCHIK